MEEEQGYFSLAANLQRLIQFGLPFFVDWSVKFRFQYICLEKGISITFRFSILADYY